MAILDWLANNYTSPILIGIVVTFALFWPFWEKLLRNAADASWAALARRFSTENVQHRKEGH